MFWIGWCSRVSVSGSVLSSESKPIVTRSPFERGDDRKGIWGDEVWYELDLGHGGSTMCCGRRLFLVSRGVGAGDWDDRLFDSGLPSSGHQNRTLRTADADSCSINHRPLRIRFVVHLFE